MPGHIQLRNDGDVPFTGKSDQFTNILKTVGTVGISPLFPVLRIVELGIEARLRAPCWIIGQMPVESVELVPG